MSLGTLVLRYGFFAVLATLANLGTQRLVLLGGGEARLFLPALAMGTLVGLVVKYLLDKQWIFFDRAAGLGAHGRKFSLYTLMGVATTALFWGTETLFWWIGGTHAARETGAVLGLAVGYVVKYNLDKQYVFRQLE
ncbi:GtrA family protein (plasmid) [Cereibacter azotoformans]|uniref:GtrA family protein n=1 Tax=Cereibacter azotoformans TaxID=43057 RepID=UPI000C6CD8BF|nr:GtrA family protein [Cereibacter azotoformans]AXQ95948.1 GtrA family protein [Cereibacter sphaeroides]UIJ33017.1 GtrA family protein [Cereibacter azotoformans]ULB12025.1 GtrA family protein [Cereibacter azotoformans]